MNMNKVPAEYTLKPILSKLVRANGVPQAGEVFHIVANEAQRTALTKLNKLAGLTRLEAFLTVRPRGKDLHVRGAVTADVVYNCVRTLEPFLASVVEKIDITYAPPQGKQHKHVDLSFGDSAPENLVGGQADIGALVQEFFQLALDPYPHKPGTSFDDAILFPSAGGRPGGGRQAEMQSGCPHPNPPLEGEGKA
jgi:hypothetical protein